MRTFLDDEHCCESCNGAGNNGPIIFHIRSLSNSVEPGIPHFASFPLSPQVCSKLGIKCRSSV
ncbi:hypothetical protein ANCCAN_06907 [Ancylostoma caninum]|uniref:Uncharacterized protein n=1 Tax=Ancylostoma caninum TaxID=29170 RepID=A0A368GRT2_ANCCA|nr:hypothetical protein ANCCAN_06907 [Ancylostoma caninum]